MSIHQHEWDCIGYHRRRYNRLFQQLLTYRHATLQLQHLPRPLDEMSRLWAAFKAQLCFFWSQADVELWEGEKKGWEPWDESMLVCFFMFEKM